MKQDVVVPAEWKHLGALLRREREACGLSVREIERRSGVSFRTLYAYENAENNGGIDLKKLAALCSVIGCEPGELITKALFQSTHPSWGSDKAENRGDTT